MARNQNALNACLNKSVAADTNKNSYSWVTPLSTPTFAQNQHKRRRPRLPGPRWFLILIHFTLRRLNKAPHLQIPRDQSSPLRRASLRVNPVMTLKTTYNSSWNNLHPLINISLENLLCRIIKSAGHGLMFFHSLPKTEAKTTP